MKSLKEHYALRKGQRVKFHAFRKDENGWFIPEFQIGNQVFALQSVDTKKTAKWTHSMLKKAFKNLLDGKEAKA